MLVKTKIFIEEGTSTLSVIPVCCYGITRPVIVIAKPADVLFIPIKLDRVGHTIKKSCKFANLRKEIGEYGRRCYNLGLSGFFENTSEFDIFASLNTELLLGRGARS